jgi:hypothetical protein
MPESERAIKKFIPLLLLLLIAIISTWPLWIYSMKFDLLDQYLPWRMLTGDLLRNGMLPLWNPYTHLGYPLYADPQSGAWYPVTWLIGTTFGYNLYSIHSEYLLHLWIAGTGMFFLVKALVRNKDIALLAAVSYMLSGFFTGNAQHLTWIISGAWMPYILFSFLMMIKTGNSKYALYGAFVLMMLFTGGYPAFTITAAYLLVFLSVWMIYKFRRSTMLRQHILNIFLFAIFAMLLSAPMIVSSFESFQSAGRAGGLSRDLAMANPFSPQSLISFLFPLSAIRNQDFFDTDISMSNGFFGMILLLGFAFSLFQKKSPTQKIILYGSLFSILAAMGSYTPVRGWMYDFIPFMKLFRMPSLFRLYAIIGFILLGSSALHRLYIENRLQVLKRPLLILILIAILVPLSFIISGQPFKLPDTYTGIADISFAASFLIQGILVATAASLMIILINKKAPVYLLTLDLVLTAWVCAPITLVSTLSTSTVNGYIKNLPRDFPVPSVAPMEQFKDRTNIFGPFWCNLGILNRQPIYDGYNNFQTRQYLAFEASPRSKRVLKNPIAYFTDPVNTAPLVSENDSAGIYKDSTFLYLDKTEGKPAMASDGKSRLSIKEFKPASITIETSAAEKYLTLQQQFHVLWKATIDNNPAEIIRSNGFTMSVLIPKGEHVVRFVYQDARIVKALWVSIIGFIMMTILLLRKRPIYKVHHEKIISPGPSPLP